MTELAWNLGAPITINMVAELGAPTTMLEIKRRGFPALIMIVGSTTLASPPAPETSSHERSIAEDPGVLRSRSDGLFRRGLALALAGYRPRSSQRTVAIHS